MPLHQQFLPALAALLVFTLPAAAQLKKQTWRNTAGKEITAGFENLRDGTVSLRLPGGGLFRIALTDLAWESARQAIALKWTPGGFADLRLEVPDRAGASAAFLKLTKVPPGEAAPDGWTRYRCAHFDFDSQTELTPAAVTSLAGVFESTRTLLEELPWRIEAVPERGTRFRALIYRDEDAYHAGGGPRGSLGVYKGQTGEIHLPLSGAGSSADTLQHELTHQMMQRLLPVIPWWVAEGAAEYVAIMKYENGSYDCKTVSKKQVLPPLEARAPYCTDAAFLRALEYRAETQAEQMMEAMAEMGTGTQRVLREMLAASAARVQGNLARLEERKKLYVQMFALEPGQSCLLPDLKDEPALDKKPPPTEGRRGARMAPGAVAGSASQLELYATSTLMVYYLTTLAPDRGERFARYMWGVQQLRDEYDLSMKRFAISAADYRKQLMAVERVISTLDAEVEKKAVEYAAYFKAAHKHANTCGHFEDAAGGQSRFVHTPDSSHPPPVPPAPPALKFPAIPDPPALLLTAAELKARREALLHTLMEGGKPLDFIARVKDAALKLGLKPGVPAPR